MNKISIKKIITFAIAVVRHTIDGFRKLYGIQYEMRIHECLTCDSLDDTPTPFEHCNECGCPVREKASWKSERCPRNKWYVA